MSVCFVVSKSVWTTCVCMFCLFVCLFVSNKNSYISWLLPYFFGTAPQSYLKMLSQTKGPYSQSYRFSSSHVWMWELNLKEDWASKNWCFWNVVLEKTWESLGLQGDQTSPCERKPILKGMMLKLQYFSHLMQRPDSLEKTLRLGKIEDKRRRGWQRSRWWMASLTQWTWVWASSGRWWRTGKPGMLQRVRHEE